MGGGGGLYPRSEVSSLNTKLTVTDKGTETGEVESSAPTLRYHEHSTDRILILSNRMAGIATKLPRANILDGEINCGGHDFVLRVLALSRVCHEELVINP